METLEERSLDGSRVSRPHLSHGFKVLFLFSIFFT